MSRKAVPSRPRIAVKLDAGIAVESVLLNRLEQVPERRREEWLRSLLLRGFQKECRELCRLNRRPRGVSSKAPEAATVDRSIEDGCVPALNCAGEPHETGNMIVETSRPATIVSMAALRKVIG